MPLLDHFAPPLSRTHPWRGFHAAWATAIARHLNRDVLPDGFYAVPLVDQPGPIEIDVATLRHSSRSEPSGPVTEPWVAPEPGASVALELPREEALEVHIFADAGEPRLTAAIELVSPRNKDRPQARQAFAAKCYGYLNQGCSVVVVDTVTSRRIPLTPLILTLLNLAPESLTFPPGLSAIAFQVSEQDLETQQLRVWPEPLTLGRPLPTLPLWLAPDFSVPLELESTYCATCEDLRIRQAG